MQWTHSELHRDGEVVTTRLLRDGVTTFYAWQIDERRLCDAGLAFDGLDDALGETETCVGHGEGGRSCTVLGFDDFVATELDTWIDLEVSINFVLDDISVTHA